MARLQVDPIFPPNFLKGRVAHLCFQFFINVCVYFIIIFQYFVVSFCKNTGGGPLHTAQVTSHSREREIGSKQGLLKKTVQTHRKNGHDQI